MFEMMMMNCIPPLVPEASRRRPENCSIRAFVTVALQQSFSAKPLEPLLACDAEREGAGNGRRGAHEDG